MGWQRLLGGLHWGQTRRCMRPQALSSGPWSLFLFFGVTLWLSLPHSTPVGLTRCSEELRGLCLQSLQGRWDQAPVPGGRLGKWIILAVQHKGNILCGIAWDWAANMRLTHWFWLTQIVYRDRTMAKNICCSSTHPRGRSKENKWEEGERNEKAGKQKLQVDIGPKGNQEIQLRRILENV